MAAAALQVGKGFHFARNFEARLYLLGGYDYIKNTGDGVSGDDDSGNLAYIIGAGARLAVNIYYPVQLLAGLEANTLFGEDLQYKINRLDIGDDRAGVSFYVGLRICF